MGWGTGGGQSGGVKPGGVEEVDLQYTPWGEWGEEKTENFTPLPKACPFSHGLFHLGPNFLPINGVLRMPTENCQRKEVAGRERSRETTPWQDAITSNGGGERTSVEDSQRETGFKHLGKHGKYCLDVRITPSSKSKNAGRRTAP